MFFKLVILSSLAIFAISAETVDECGAKAEDYNTLDFNHKYLYEVPKFTFESHVKVLDLQLNRLTKINQGAFDNAPNLEELNLSSNRISFENLFSFGSLSKLKKLCLGSQEIPRESSPPTISINFPLPNLERLSLANLYEFNIITENWETFVPKLTTLDLKSSCHGHSHLGEMMKNLTRVKKLGISECNLDSLRLVKLHNFEDIDVSRNDFESLLITDDPKTCDSERQLCVGLMKGLKKLTAAYCQIKTFVIDYWLFDPVPHLATLNLGRNKLKTLGNPLSSNVMISKLSMLRSLNLAANYFDSIETFCNLRNLSELHVGSADDSTFPLDLSESVEECLPNLKELHVTGSGIRELPQRLFGKLKKLKVLNVSRNKLKDLSSVPKTLQKLTVNHNLLGSVEDLKLDEFEALEELNIEKNWFLPSDYEYLVNATKAKNIKHLDFRHQWFGPY